MVARRVVPDAGATVPAPMERARRHMVQLLHIDASARRESYSRRVSRIFADAWRTANPDGGYVYRDLAANPVPHVDEAQTEINEYSGVHGLQGLEPMEQAVQTPAQQAAWAITRPLVEELLAADVLL